MGPGAVIEPLVVIILLFGGTWINKATGALCHRRIENEGRKSRDWSSRANSPDVLESGLRSPTVKTRLLRDRSLSPPPRTEDGWRKRRISTFGTVFEVTSPDTSVFQNRLFSRVLRNFPFLMECWYWALVYWTYQVGRAVTAFNLQQDAVDVARKHALQLIQIEQKLGIFWELQIQKFFLSRAHLMIWISRIYSFIHIPGTIAFLVWLYYYTITRNRLGESATGSPAGPYLYQARRRTLAVCNLLAFVVFTLWPCMPPRLLSDKNAEGPDAELARSYGFVDTVHGTKGTGSVWTENRFCNQYAAMPSLHFGYSLMIGLTIMTIPLSPRHRWAIARPRFSRLFGLQIPSWRRLVCLVVGFAYPFIILVAIIATANHFILDAVVGALVCALGWRFNDILLNLLPLEDYFLWVIRTQKPEPITVDTLEDDDDWDNENIRGEGCSHLEYSHP